MRPLSIPCLLATALSLLVTFSPCHLVTTLAYAQNTAPATAPSTAPSTAPAQALAVEIYDGYFVKNTFEPNSPSSFVVLKDQNALDNVLGVGMVMGDRSHRLAPTAFNNSLVLVAIHRGPLTTFSQVSATLQNGALTLTYTAKAQAPNTATYNSPLIVSVPKTGITKIVFLENGQKAAEKPVD